MDIGYAIVPLVAWVTAGSSKFIVNSVKAGKPAFDRIGYGGLPSSHTAIVSGAAGLIAIREGIAHPAFGVAVALLLIVVMDAHGLRRQIGRHADVLNRLRNDEGKALRERIGHTGVEILAGAGVGLFSAWLVNLLLPLI